MALCFKFFEYVSVIVLMAFMFCVGIFAESSKNCSCVPFYQCTDDGNGLLISDGRGLLDIRRFENTKCSGHFDICCKMTAIPREDTPKKPSGCGYQTTEFYPWSAALYYTEFSQFAPRYKCGVSLIHPQAALTAAHCLDTKGTFMVRIGSTARLVSKTAVHPSYNPINLQNDIAVVFLKAPVAIDPICVPPFGTNFDDAVCTVATLTETPNSKYLSIVKVPVVERNECANSLKTTRLGPFFHLHRSFMCAGGEAEKDTCGGDGGSPLICPVPGQPGRYHQVGIVSWGIGCGKSNIPGVYVNLPLFRDWIDDVMVRGGFDINSYRY